MLRPQDRTALPCRSAPGSGSQSQRVGFARNRPRGKAPPEGPAGLGGRCPGPRRAAPRSPPRARDQKLMENREIARLLWETADLMEIAGEDSFRIRSYRNAASVIEGYPEPVSAILKDPARKVTEIPGIGKGIASALEEIEQRGSFERRDQMLEVYPPTALELLKIQGLGPKGIRTLFEHYRVSTIDGLEKICQEQKLRELPRMGAKLEEKVLRSIAAYRQRAGRFLLSFAYGVVDELVTFLNGIQG